MIFAIVCIASYNIQPVTLGLRYLFGPPYLVVSNILACHVLRAMMLCGINDAESCTGEMTTLDPESLDFRGVSLTVNGSQFVNWLPPAHT